MNRLEICVSDRCFFPRSAFEGSRKVVEQAKDLGYEQVEFHPTWAIWLEVLTRGGLNCRPEDISSFHISWWEDGVHHGYGFLKRNFLIPAYRVFPPEPLGTKALQKLEKRYGKPVVIHWPDDFTRFDHALLELHGLLGMSSEEIENELKKETIKGIVLDTDKFADWLKRTQEKSEALQRFFQHIDEVHFRFRGKDDVKSLSGKGETESLRVMEELVKMGYNGRVVVEMGWPDKGSIEVLGKEGLEEVHQTIVKFLRNL